MKPQPLGEQLRLVVASVSIAPVKLVLAILCLILCNMTCRLAQLLPGSRVRGDVTAALGKFWCSTCLLCLGFVIKWVKSEKGEGEIQRAGGIVSNHMSWVDILIHLSHSFPACAAREGTQNIPFVGFISSCLQCVFVNRENKKPGTQGVSSQIMERMNALVRDPKHTLRPMLLFPEGTTTNGRFLLPFKTGAFLAGVPLQPILIRYDDKAPFSVCWESVPILRHIWLMLCQPFHFVTCYELPVYVPSAEEQRDPTLYANNVREYMLKFSKLKPIDATFTDKLEYLRAIKGEADKVEASAAAGAPTATAIVQGAGSKKG